ncbi:glutamate--cysteine ligase [Weissella minor]|uniref:glutamate--cysteine ligase n=1 Tax=Weissella minor TaxID=1620 RepID=UPI003AF1F292
MNSQINSVLPDHLTINQLINHLGLEIEEHRVQMPDGHLSQHPHPVALGDRRTQANFQTDFSESQEELVTDPNDTSADALNQLHTLQKTLTAQLAPDEIIWPLSMPPYLTENDLTYLDTHFERPWYGEYRRVLIDRYGYYQHIMTGIHVNFSLSSEALSWGTQNMAYPDCDAVYFQILKQVSKYRWLITYLFGASLVSENQAADHLLQQRPDLTEPVRSWRSSSIGFDNYADIQPTFTSLSAFLHDIQQLVASGKLYDQSEYYGPVRVKQYQADQAPAKTCVNYLEFRIFDIDPFSTDGISPRALSVLELLIFEAIYFPEDKLETTMLQSKANNDLVALQHPNVALPTALQDEFKHLLAHMQALTDLVDDDAQQQSWQDAINYMTENIEAPVSTLSQQLLPHLVANSLHDFALQRGQAWKQAHEN